MLKIELLADCPTAMDTLVEAFAREWPDHYMDRESALIRREFEGRRNREALPISVVATEHGEPVGTATLGGHSVEAHDHLQPWVTGLWVDRRCRRRGIGRTLVREIESIAAKLGYSMLYAGTSDTIAAFNAWEWEAFDVAMHEGEALTLVRRRLEP